MRALLTFLALACIAAAVPPMPKIPRHYRHAEITQGDGALDLIRPVPAKPGFMAIPLPISHIFTWRYPASINPSNYFWNIEQATSPLGPWSVVVSNATGATNLFIQKNEPLRIYRLSGRLVP